MATHLSLYPEMNYNFQVPIEQTRRSRRPTLLTPSQITIASAWYLRQAEKSHAFRSYISVREREQKGKKKKVKVYLQIQQFNRAAGPALDMYSYSARAPSLSESKIEKHSHKAQKNGMSIQHQNYKYNHSPHIQGIRHASFRASTVRQN